LSQKKLIEGKVVMASYGQPGVLEIRTPTVEGDNSYFAKELSKYMGKKVTIYIEEE
jgi:hypothetical protein